MGAKRGAQVGGTAGYVAGAKFGAEAGSFGGPIGAAVGAVLGAAIGALTGSGPDKLGPKKRAAFEAAGGIVRRGRYYFGAERIGTRAARRIAQGSQAGVVQFPKQPKRPPPAPPAGSPPPPRQPGPITTGAGVGVGAAAATAVLQSLPPVVQWVWNEAQQRWEQQWKRPRTPGPTRRYRRMSQLDIINAQIRRNSQIGTWSGNVNANLPPAGGVRPIPGGPAAVEERVRIMREPLEEVKVTAKRLPVPAVPTLPVGYRIYKAAVTKLGLPGAARYYPAVRKLAPLALIAAKDLIAPGQKRRKVSRESPGLTPVQQPGVGYMPSFSPFASIAAQPALQPETARKCKCKPCKKPKKRGPRKPRSICYRGTYTETRKGLSKFKREQIPCR